LEKEQEQQRPADPFAPKALSQPSWWRRLHTRDKILAVMVIVVIVVGMIAYEATRTDPYNATWVAFKGEHITLNLPDYFAGGKPTVSGEAPGSVDSLMKAVEVQLTLVGRLDSRGLRPTVYAAREHVPSDVSMQQYVDSFFAPAPFAPAPLNLTVESLTDTQAYVVASITSPADPRRTDVQHVALTRAGSYMYAVIYTAPSGPESKTLEQIFRSSAQTIVVSRP
jgi:hypothetical protein